MKCRVCGNEIPEGITRCPKCEFPVMMMVSGTAEEEAKIQEYAQQYRSEKFQNVKVSLQVYTNEMADGEVRVKETSDIVLGEGTALLGKEIIWYPENFARLTSDPKLSLEITKGDGTVVKQTVELPNPQIMDFWHVGVKPEDCMKVKVVLGNEKTYVESQEIALL